MELTDIAPLESWAQIEKEVFEKFHLQCVIYNIDGIGITGKRERTNPICTAIRATDSGQSFICATAHMNLALMAQKTHEAVIEECDAGMVKLVVPIFLKNEFLGAAGACGSLLGDGEVDTFMINKITGIDEDQVDSLSGGIGAVTTRTAQQVCAFLEERGTHLVAAFQKKTASPGVSAGQP